jgi:hypothetical protein
MYKTVVVTFKPAPARRRFEAGAPTSPRRTTILAGEIVYGVATDDFGARRTGSGKRLPEE